MNGLWRRLALAREQNEGNQQLIGIIAEIRRHAGAVEEAGTRQRAAVKQHVAAAKNLIEVSNAARQARSAFDGVPAALQARVRELTPGGTPVEFGVATTLA